MFRVSRASPSLANARLGTPAFRASLTLASVRLDFVPPKILLSERLMSTEMLKLLVSLVQGSSKVGISTRPILSQLTKLLFQDMYRRHLQKRSRADFHPESFSRDRSRSDRSHITLLDFPSIPDESPNVTLTRRARLTLTHSLALAYSQLREI